MFGAIPCWDPLEVDHGGWPGFDNKWVDYAVAKGANAFHMRLGPFVTDKQWPNGLMYEMGPYVNDDAGQGFHQPWWDRALSMCAYAESKGANCEIDLIDGWQCRHAIFGDVRSPWTPADLKACANTFTDTHRQFIRKAVEVFGCEGGVVWQDGNEIGVTSEEQGPYKAAWALAILDEVRKAEQEVGCGVVHMFGTNADREDIESNARVDYTSSHDKTFIRGPVYGKFRQCNEHNPPSSPEGERMLYCAARNAGQAWWYWRGAQSQSDMERTLSLFGQGCDGVTVDGCPFPVKPTNALACKPFGSHGGYPQWDCTPKARNGDPIWPEGDGELRSACEQKSMGGLPDFALQPPLSIHHVTHGGMGFTVAGHGASPALCSIPSPSAGFRGCVDTAGSNLVVNVP